MCIRSRHLDPLVAHQPVGDPDEMTLALNHHVARRGHMNHGAENKRPSECHRMELAFCAHACVAGKNSHLDAEGLTIRSHHPPRQVVFAIEHLNISHLDIPLARNGSAQPMLGFSSLPGAQVDLAAILGQPDFEGRLGL